MQARPARVRYLRQFCAGDSPRGRGNALVLTQGGVGGGGASAATRADCPVAHDDPSLAGRGWAWVGGGWSGGEGSEAAAPVRVHPDPPAGGARLLLLEREPGGAWIYIHPSIYLSIYINIYKSLRTNHVLHVLQAPA